MSIESRDPLERPSIDKDEFPGSIVEKNKEALLSRWQKFRDINDQEKKTKALLEKDPDSKEAKKIQDELKEFDEDFYRSRKEKQGEKEQIASALLAKAAEELEGQRFDSASDKGKYKFYFVDLSAYEGHWMVTGDYREDFDEKIEGKDGEKIDEQTSMDIKNLTEKLNMIFDYAVGSPESREQNEYMENIGMTIRGVLEDRFGKVDGYNISDIIAGLKRESKYCFNKGEYQKEKK